jgi:tRNA A-37 threonylcarbamoyl transferase component Bud32
MYQQHFPHCQTPERKTFSTLDRQLRENRTFNGQMTISTGQQVAQLHDRYIMMMMMTTSNYSVKHLNKKAEFLLSFLQIQRQAPEE